MISLALGHKSTEGPVQASKHLKNKSTVFPWPSSSWSNFHFSILSAFLSKPGIDRNPFLKILWARNLAFHSAVSLAEFFNAFSIYPLTSILDQFTFWLWCGCLRRGSVTIAQFHSFKYLYLSLRSVTSVVSHSLWPYGLYPTRLLYPWNSPGKNTEVGCHALLQGIFLTQGSNRYLLSSALAVFFFLIN